MKRRLVMIAALSLAPLTSLRAADASQPAVQVTSVPARFGRAPDLIQAYGVATPAANGTETLSLPEDGRVARILVTAGEPVKKGQALLQWEQSPTARQAWEQARTALVLAQQQRAHVAMLLDRHLATRDQLDQAVKAQVDAQSSVDTLRRVGADRPVRPIPAPFDGAILTLPVAQGQRVAPGTPLATLVRTGGIVVTVGVDAGRWHDLQIGQSAQLSPIAGGATLDARLVRFDSVLDPQTRLVSVDLSVPPGSLLAGTYCQAAITVGTLSGWLVPHAAVLQDAGGTYLFQVNGDHASRVAVKVLRTADEPVEGAAPGTSPGTSPGAFPGATDIVSGPLDTARPIVLDGAYQLSDGAALRQTATP